MVGVIFFGGVHSPPVPSEQNNAEDVQVAIPSRVVFVVYQVIVELLDEVD